MRYDALAWVAMMLVDPAERRAGFGAQLLAEALAALADAPCVGLDATPLGEPLYRRFGFVADYSLARTKAIVDCARLPELAGPARLMRESDLAAVCRWDREVFGADRSRLLASLFDRAPECAWVVDDARTCKGYTFGRPGYLYGQLGPVVAADAGTARELVTRCLSRLGGRAFAIDAPLLDRGVARVSEIDWVRGRAQVRAYVSSGTSSPGNSGAAVRDLRAGICVTE